MTSPSAPHTEPDDLVLAGEFAAAGREQWQQLVERVLRKTNSVPEGYDDPVETLLATRTYDGVILNPLYTEAKAVPGYPGLPPYLRGGRPEGNVASGWDVRQRHADPGTTAETVLADLENGVSSLWLVVGAAGLPVDRIGDVLRDVYLDLAPVTLDAGAEFAAAAEELLRVHADKGIPASEVKGNLGADPLGHHARTGQHQDLDGAAELARKTAADYPRLRSIVVDGLPYHQAGGSDAEELGAALAAGVAYLRALTAAGLDVDAAAGQLEFRLAATADQFLTIAKFRAARRLWARVAEVSGVTKAGSPRQHAVTSPAMVTRRDPWVNMLRTTLACFGAGVGGADAVTVLPFDHALGLPDGFARRIARNTQAVLLEESHLAGVIDPAGGSWYVETLSDELAKAAWAWFTEIERAGGLVAALDAGLVADRLATTWAARSANLATRADAITGVSEFPNLAERAPVRPPAPAAPAGGLPVVRYAEAYEELRDLSDRVLGETGARPRVFLATLGPVAAHTARAGFAANLFQAGGIETPTGGVITDAETAAARFTESGAAVACLCGSEKSYAELVGPVTEALKAAGATQVLLAGKPSDDHLRSGVDGFVFTGCDAPQVLRATLETLGVTA
ncbi:methylmalonyl-CoA mutase family protein [Actinokineospora sp. NBRC 105648]|uniref:methylmalonyl-CoA mutase family protein n=1 Tax=Actinokineospora sp. NBRC 105648 TaxID=3032206 RepID=UPI0024A10198|nr:methylmalonyl-CoA mutase family protein [Actinokineospora sp. NBRC 105648]GLZ38585.1 methylmalonyl-CoA mutase [Actinokineospora sp. NBRC 105648]